IAVPAIPKDSSSGWAYTKRTVAILVTLTWPRDTLKRARPSDRGDVRPHRTALRPVEPRALVRPRRLVAPPHGRGRRARSGRASARRRRGHGRPRTCAGESRSEWPGHRARPGARDAAPRAHTRRCIARLRRRERRGAAVPRRPLLMC